MKKIMKISLGIFAAIAIVGTLFAFTQPNHQQSAVKAKPLTVVTFQYLGTDETATNIENTSNWVSGTPSCATGSIHLCYMSFDTGTYPLDGHGNPSQALLDIVFADFATGTTPYTKDGITFYLKN